MWGLLIATALGADALTGVGRASRLQTTRRSATVSAPAAEPATEKLAFNAKIADAFQTNFCARLSFLCYDFNPLPNKEYEFSKGEGVLVKDLLDPTKGYMAPPPPPPPPRSKGFFGGVLGLFFGGETPTTVADVYRNVAVDVDQFTGLDPDMRLIYLGDQNDDTFSLAVDCPASKQVVVAIRGTDPASPKNDVSDIKIEKVPWTLDGAETYVHEGYYDQFQEVREDLDAAVKSVLEKYPDRKLLVTGHSMGGALSTLVGAHLAVEYPENKVRVTNFGSPRVGNNEFKAWCESRANLRHTRVIYHKDVVPRMFLLGYEHVGHLVYLSPDKTTPDAYRFGEGTPYWMYLLPPLQALKVSDHTSAPPDKGYVQCSEDWADAVRHDMDTDGI